MRFNLIKYQAYSETLFSKYVVFKIHLLIGYSRYSLHGIFHM